MEPYTERVQPPTKVEKKASVDPMVASILEDIVGFL